MSGNTIINLEIHIFYWNDQQLVEDNGLNSKLAFAIFEFKMVATWPNSLILFPDSLMFGFRKKI